MGYRVCSRTGFRAPIPLLQKKHKHKREEQGSWKKPEGENQAVPARVRKSGVTAATICHEQVPQVTSFIFQRELKCQPEK